MGIAQVAFWYLRHGETDWNAQNLSQGQVEVPLNANGVAQAHAAAALLRGHGIASIVSSPLGRARATAAVAAEALGLAIEVEPDLQEVSFGVQEGQAMVDWFDAWIAGERTPERAESFAELRARGVRALNLALARPAPVLVVAHGALFRALRAEMGLSPLVRTANATPLFCSPGEPWTVTTPEG